jgi:hypothetical protein
MRSLEVWRKNSEDRKLEYIMVGFLTILPTRRAANPTTEVKFEVFKN